MLSAHRSHFSVSKVPPRVRSVLDELLGLQQVSL